METPNRKTSVHVDTRRDGSSSEASHFLPPCDELSSEWESDTIQAGQHSWIARLKSSTDTFHIASSACATFTFMIFLFNLSVFVWATAHHGWPDSGRQQLYRGNCKTAARLNSGFHLLINVFSTLLISFSGYCMQYLSAPTRQEVSRAHAKRRWLNVGTLSMRNLINIERKRMSLWLILCLTSSVLHLAYNSMIFITYSSNTYWPVQVSSAFVENPSAPFLYEPQFDNQTSGDPAINNTLSNKAMVFKNEVERLRTLLEQSVLERLETASCIDAYNVRYQTSYGSVLLVSTNSTSTVHQECHRACLLNCEYSNATPCSSSSESTWMCADSSRLFGFISSCLMQAQELRSSTSQWRLNGDTFDDTLSTSYCLAEKRETLCLLQTSPVLAIIVLGLNLAKTIAMFMVSRLHTGRSLVTIGDFVRSFLETPDQYTKNMCLASFQDIKKMRKQWVPAPKSYSHTRFHCLVAGGKLQWAVGILLSAIPVGYGLYAVCMMRTARSISSWGFGTSSVAVVVTLVPSMPTIIPESFLAMAFTANVPQIWLSALYFLTNGFVTAICAQLEWASYTKDRKGLRVSNGKCGSQRSTYFLQLPYRYSVPLLTIFGLLHWLVSQSLFLIDEAQGPDVLESNSSRTYLGWSPLSSLISVSVTAALMVFLIVQGLWKINTPMPLLGSCSAVIAAACQPTGDAPTSGAHLEEVKWGVICERMESATGEIGHCGFSDGYVGVPVEGNLYAGLE